MLPHWHVLIGLIFSSIIWLMFPSIGFIGFMIILLSAFFIDFDHYLYYVYQKHDLSLKNAYSWFIKRSKFLHSLTPKQRQQYKKPILIFHGIEFWLILVLLALIHQIFLFVIAGAIIHIACDLIQFIYINEPLYSKLSQILTFILNKNKKLVF